MYFHRIRQKTEILPIILLGIFFTLGLLSLRHKTLTVDEDGHWRYGAQILALNSDRFDDSKMPATALNAIPLQLAELLPGGALQNVLRKLPTARVVTLVAAVLLGYLCYQWSRRLYGLAPGLLTVFLFAFEPNLIAHARLVTTDLYAAATVTWALYAGWRYSREQDRRWALLLGFVVGLSLLAKYSAVFLLGLLPVILILVEAPAAWAHWQRGNRRAVRALGRRLLGHGLLAGGVILLVVNAGFLFNRTFTPLQDYEFQSELFRRIQTSLTNLPFIRIPVPYPFLEGLDLVRFRERSGFGFGDIYLLGRLSKDGFPGYYLVAYLFKVPLAAQLLLVLAVLAPVFGWKNRRIRRDELFLILPVLFYGAYFNFFYRAQIGIRFLLLIFPLLLIYSGSLVEQWPAWKRPARVGVLALGAAMVLSVLSYFPHYIPYFNELVPNRRNAYRVLADSNIDWDQAEWYLDRYLEAHPEAVLSPDAPVAGRLVVEVNRLTGVAGDPAPFAWLRETQEPVDTIAYTYLVYEVTAEDLERVPASLRGP